MKTIVPKYETRIRYILNRPSYPGRKFNEHEIHTWEEDGWFSGTTEGAANYPWLMNNCIVWMEERIVYYDAEPWGPIEIRDPFIHDLEEKQDG